MTYKADSILEIIDDLQSNISKLVYSNRQLQPKHVRALDEIEEQISLLRTMIIKEVRHESDTGI